MSNSEFIGVHHTIWVGQKYDLYQNPQIILAHDSSWRETFDNSHQVWLNILVQTKDIVTFEIEV